MPVGRFCREQRAFCLGARFDSAMRATRGRYGRQDSSNNRVRVSYSYLSARSPRACADAASPVSRTLQISLSRRFLSPIEVAPRISSISSRGSCPSRPALRAAASGSDGTADPLISLLDTQFPWLRGQKPNPHPARGDIVRDGLGPGRRGVIPFSSEIAHTSSRGATPAALRRLRCNRSFLVLQRLNRRAAGRAT
jgi:hypothetical protein